MATSVTFQGRPVRCIVIPDEQREILIAHCLRKLDERYEPGETPEPKAYGLIGARLDDGVLTVGRIAPLRNNVRKIEPHKTFMDGLLTKHAVPSVTPLDRRGWVADPLETKRIVSELEDGGLELIGTYHMHRVSWTGDKRRDTPTKLDTALSIQTGLFMLIVSVVDRHAPSVRAFYEGDHAMEVPVTTKSDFLSMTSSKPGTETMLHTDDTAPEDYRSVGQIADSQLFGDGYGTPEARAIFSDVRRLQRWLDVEVALARCQAKIGMIPSMAAEALSKTARVDLIDVRLVREGIAATGHSLVPLLRAWQKIADPQAGQYIHYGATTQDIQDTAQSLEIREALDIVERDLLIVISELTRLAEENRDVVMIGRTHGQHALPTTLGLKFAMWLDEALRNLKRVRHSRSSVIVAQLFGGVGTMASFGSDGNRLLELFAHALGLSTPETAWHTARDRVAEFLSLLAILTGGLANIANEIVQLAKSDVGELAEAFEPGMISSSTMPHKRNPEMSERIVLLAKLVKSKAGLGFEALCNEHERDYRAVRLEWVAVTDAVLHTCAALALTKNVLGSLVVDRARIAENVEKAAASICSEPLMFKLGKVLGKQNAYQLVYEAWGVALDRGTSLTDALFADDRVSHYFTHEVLCAATQPANYLGLAGDMVDTMVTKARQVLDPSGSGTVPPDRCAHESCREPQLES